MHENLLKYFFSTLLILTWFDTNVVAFAQQVTPKDDSEVSVLPVSVVKVREKGTGLPLSKTEITVASETVFTSGNGEAQITIPPSGDGFVRLSRSGFETLEVPFAKFRPAGTFDIFLYPRTPDDNNIIIVTGKKRPQVSRKTVSIEESRRIAPGGDPAQIVKLLPGVQTSSARGGSGNSVVVRGSGPADSKFYIDNLEVPFIFHGIGNISVLPAQLMQEVQFDAGGFGPEFGNATGGVIVIRTKTDIPERPKTDFLVNIPFYSGVFQTRPLSEKSALTVSVRRSYVEFFIDKVLESQEEEAGGNLTIVPYFGDAHVVHIQKTDTGHTKTSLIAAYDGVKAAAPSQRFADEEGRAKIDFVTEFLNLGVERVGRLNESWQYTTTPQIYFFDTDANFVGNALRRRVLTFRVPTEFSRRLGPAKEWIIGLDPSYKVQWSDVNAIDFRPGDPTFDPEDAEKRKVTSKVKTSDVAAYTSVDVSLGKMIITPGARVTYDSQIKKLSADPRLRLRQPLGSEHTLKSAIGQYSQAPSPFQSSENFGNPKLSFYRAYHFVLGLETQWNDKWTSDVQGFYKLGKNMVVSDPKERFSNNGSMRGYGAEFFIRRNLTGRLFGWLSYTYAKSENRSSDDEPYRYSEYDQTHVINLAGSYKLTAQWELGTRYNFHTGDTYTPVNDAVYNANLDKYQDRTLDSQKNTSRLPNFHALTIYATKSFLFDTWKMALKFGFESYWPTTQVVGVDYNYDYSKKVDETSLTSIPFIELSGEL